MNKWKCEDVLLRVLFGRKLKDEVVGGGEGTVVSIESTASESTAGVKSALRHAFSASVEQSSAAECTCCMFKVSATYVY